MTYSIASHQSVIKCFGFTFKDMYGTLDVNKGALAHALESFIYIQCLQYFSPEDIADEKMSLYSFISY